MTTQGSGGRGSVSDQRKVLGRYVLYDAVAAGGMATVHLGRLQGPVGFARTVAIKRLHPHLARDQEFVTAFLDEARLAARIRHPNVVPTLDVVALDGELLLVMEFVQGETLSKLLARAAGTGGIPPPIISAIMIATLEGLHAAHEARSDRGEPLHIVHRDVSPQNVMVGSDGIARVLDFGVAKATGRLQESTEGAVKGKFAYMSPEQLNMHKLDRRTDVFAAAVVLWELLTGQRLFAGDQPAAIIQAVMNKEIPPPSSVVRGLPRSLDEVVLRGLSRDAALRFGSAHEMAVALEGVMPPASPLRVAEWVNAIARDSLSDRARRVETIESESSVDPKGLGALEVTRTPSAEAPFPQVASASAKTSSAFSGAPAPARANKMALVAGFLALGVALGVIGYLTQGRVEAPAIGSPPPSSAEMSVSPTPSLAPQPSMVPSVVPEPQSSIAASASASAPPTARAWPAAVRPTAAVTVTPTPKTPADCATRPWNVLPDGKKKLRPECS